MNKTKPVVCVDTGELFESLTAAGKAKSIDPACISMCARDMLGTSGGLRWRFATPSETRTGLAGDFDIERKPKRTRYGEIVVCVETGEVFPSALEAARKYGSGHPFTLYRVLNGAADEAFGLHWRRATDDEIAAVFPHDAPRLANSSGYARSYRAVVCTSTAEYFPSLSHAARAIGTTVTAVHNCASGKTRSCAGLLWRFATEEEQAARAAMCEPVGMAPERVHRGKRVVCVETGEVYESMSAAARAKGLSGPICIGSVIGKPSRTAAGFHWVHADR